MRRYRLLDHQPLPLLGSEPEDEIEVLDDLIGDIEVRTKFLGYTTSRTLPAPDVFETMVYAKPPPFRRWHYATWDEAVRGHAEVVAQIRRQAMGAG